jgi:hypothetical protein
MQNGKWLAVLRVLRLEHNSIPEWKNTSGQSQGKRIGGRVLASWKVTEFGSRTS